MNDIKFIYQRKINILANLFWSCIFVILGGLLLVSLTIAIIDGLVSNTIKQTVWIVVVISLFLSIPLVYIGFDNLFHHPLEIWKGRWWRIKWMAGFDLWIFSTYMLFGCIVIVGLNPQIFDETGTVNVLYFVTPLVILGLMLLLTKPFLEKDKTITKVFYRKFTELCIKDLDDKWMIEDISDNEKELKGLMREYTKINNDKHLYKIVNCAFKIKTLNWFEREGLDKEDR